MVDFQSRDTRRGVGGDDDDDEDDGSEPSAEEQADAEGQADAEAGEPATADETTGAAEDAGADESSPAGDGPQSDPDDTAAEPTAGRQGDPLAEEESGPSGDTEAGDDPLAEGQSGPDQGAETEAETDPLAEERPDPAPTGGSESVADQSGRDERADGAARAGASTEQASGRAGGTPGDKTTTEPRERVEPTTPTDVIPAAVAVVTVGTTTDGGDPTGDAVVSSLEGAGHSVPTRERLRGEYDSVQGTVDTLVGRDDVDAVVVAGGTGVREDEVTIEAVHPLFSKALPGFGEVFRDILAEEIGTGVVAVRATAGIADRVPVFCIPGDAEVATLAVKEVIAEEVGRLADHLP